MARKKFVIAAHPTKHELMAFAESVEDDRSTVNARLAAHVASCARCATRVAAMRGTLAIVAGAGEIEPTPELTAKLLRAAREQRETPVPALAAMFGQPAGVVRQKHAGGVIAALTKGVAVAASLAVIASLSFHAALGEPQPERLQGVVMAAPVTGVTESEPALDAGKVLREIQMFAAAISVGQGQQSVWEREQRRLVVDLDAELQAAKEALQHNPGSARANHVYYANLERTAQTLRALYIRGD